MISVNGLYKKGALIEEHAGEKLDGLCLEDTRDLWCLAYPSRGPVTILTLTRCYVTSL